MVASSARPASELKVHPDVIAVARSHSLYGGPCFPVSDLHHPLMKWTSHHKIRENVIVHKKLGLLE